MASTTALYTGLSGLNANARALDVIGNNIANANTTALKTTRMLFSNSFSRLESSAGDMRGTPRLRSLKRLVPHSISRRISTVQREHRISAPIATGQNCP